MFNRLSQHKKRLTLVALMGLAHGCSGLASELPDSPKLSLKLSTEALLPRVIHLDAAKYAIASETSICDEGSSGFDSASAQGMSSTALPPLTLGDALAVILCKSPAMAAALAAIQEQHALVNLADLAWRPRLNAQIEARISQSPATAESFALRTRLLGAGLGLNWVLFDFGLRNANLSQARASFQAAIANQSSAVLSQITEGLRLYVEAQASRIRLDSLNQAQLVAEQSYAVAAGRYSAQIGSLSEKLLAQTALAQAQLEHTRAQGAWQIARGNLAVALGLDTRTILELAAIDQAFPAFEENFNWQQLRETALANHPRIRTVRLDMEALQARQSAVSAEAKGSVSINGNANFTQGLGGTTGQELLRNLSAGIQAAIPLLNDAETQARQRQIQAQIKNRQAQLISAERDLDSELWRSHQQLLVEIENMAAVQQFLFSAEQAYEVAQGRYKAGVGSMLELLNAQSSRGMAISQKGTAVVNIAQARMRLMLSLGSIHDSLKPKIFASQRQSLEFKNQSSFK